MAIKLKNLLTLGKEAEEWCNRITAYAPSLLLSDRVFDSKEVDLLSSRLEGTISLARELRDLPLEKLTEGKLISLIESAKAVVLRLKELKEIADLAEDPLLKDKEALDTWGQNREAFIGALNNNCETLFEVGAPIISYLSLKLAGSPKQENEIEELVAALKEAGNSALIELREKQEELERIILVARDTAAQAAVAQHAQRFGDVAQAHDVDSKKWLATAAGLVSLTVLGALLALFFFPAVGELKDVATIQRIIGKVTIISILYFGALWSAKNYRTHRHLSVLNKHRQSALQTFDAFVKAGSGDEQTKNAVLLEATRCIFAQANTGYLGKDDDDSQGNRIIEIFKMVGSAKQ